MNLIDKMDDLIGEMNGAVSADYSVGYDQGVKDAIKVVEAHDPWISVGYKLPKYGEYVLVIGVNKKTYADKAFHVCCMDDLEDGCEFMETGLFSWLTESGNRIEDVIAWMPIPKTTKP